MTPAAMTAPQFEKVLFDLFPRKVATEAAAADIIGEMRALWTFLGRAYRLPNAPTMLTRLDDQAVSRLAQALADPSNFDMAKSIIMQGRARGFDMSTEAGNTAWMLTYNAELATAGPGPLPSEPVWLAPPRPRSTRKTTEKKRRLIAKASRTKNRRT